MRGSKFIRGTPLLIADNTIPGLKLPEEISKLIPTIIKACSDFGLDFYPIIVQMLTYAEISEVAAYGGFPVRYPHWQWGMEYNELQRGYEHGMHRIYEMVVNTNPCYIYCLDSNTLVDNVTVISHAIGHNDFFKNNVYFSPTSQNMMNELANHGTRVRKYMQRWGKEKVIEFIDNVLRIETLIDPAKAFEKKIYKDPIVKDSRKYHQPVHFDVKDGHDYMDSYVNPKEWIDGQRKKIEREDAADFLEIFQEPIRDVMGFIRDNAPLKPWQADIIAMLHEEMMYFSPQGPTKMLNEGWASFIDFKMMAEKGMCCLGQDNSDKGIIQYALHKMGVLGGKYSMNPYHIGFCLFQDIEERWNKGKFGAQWDDCKNLKQREDWDQKLGLGHNKVLEVRKYYNDFTAIAEFFTPEFCDKYEFYEWEHMPNGTYVLLDRDPKKIRKKLMARYLNGGLPDVRLVDPNHRGKRVLFLEHRWDGQLLFPPYTKATLESLRYLWGNTVCLSTRNSDDKEIVYVCKHGEVMIMTREDYERVDI